MAFDFSTLSDLRTAEVISGETVRLLAARSAESLLRHPALLYAGGINTMTSNVVTVGQYGLDGYDIFGSVADGGTVSATDLTDAAASITVARYALRYTPTDLARMTDNTGLISAPRFAQSMIRSANQTLVSLIAPLGSGFSNSVGTSGVDATVADHLAAKATLEDNNVEGPYVALYHPTQWSDIVLDMQTASGGAVQWNPAAPGILASVGNGYKGEFAGVSIYTSTRVPASGGNRQGFMFGMGAIAWADGSAPLDDPANQALYGNLLFERSRNAEDGTTDWIGQLYLGVSEVIDAAGVMIETDQ